MPVLLDGAVGTTLWAIAQAHGIEKVPVWIYNIEHPELVKELHQRMIAAGSEWILANTFGANTPAVRRSSSYTVDEVVRKGVQLAKECTDGTNVKVFAAAGPLQGLLEPFGDISEEECFLIYDAQLRPAIEEGADGIFLQTFMDLNMMAIAAKAAKQYDVPVFCAMTFERVGKTMFGNSVKQTIETLTPLGIDAIGMNCSLGPDLALPVIQEFATLTDLPLIFKPNAGKPILAPDGTTVTAYDADTFVKDITPAIPLVSYIGGCCGSDDTYIRLLKDAINQQ